MPSSGAPPEAAGEADVDRPVRPAQFLRLPAVVTTMKVALAQLAIEAAAVEENDDRAVAAVEEAAAAGAALVALPEVFNVGYFGFDAYARNAEPLGGPTHQRLREAAVVENVDG